MHPIGWVPAGADALLDVGCNAGEFLGHCREVHPALRLAGVEVNAAALGLARRRAPTPRCAGRGPRRCRSPPRPSPA